MRKAVFLCVLVFALLATAIGQLAEADQAFKAKQWDKAAIGYQAVVSKEPANGIAWFNLGMALHQSGKYPEAAAALEKALELKQFPFRALLGAARAYARAGNTEKAIGAIDRLAAMGYNQAPVLRNDAELASLKDNAQLESILKKMDEARTPCEKNPRNREFDFWIGAWEVQTTTGQKAGDSLIERSLDGCVLIENWTSAMGGAGKSLNTFNSSAGKWQQYWVDSSGTVTFYEGGLESGAMRVTAQQKSPLGQPGLVRMTFTPLPEGKIRQHGESSGDGGKTWTTTFDLIYVKKM